MKNKPDNKRTIGLILIKIEKIKIKITTITTKRVITHRYREFVACTIVHAINWPMRLLIDWILSLFGFIFFVTRNTFLNRFDRRWQLTNKAMNTIHAKIEIEIEDMSDECDECDDAASALNRHRIRHFQRHMRLSIDDYKWKDRSKNDGKLRTIAVAASACCCCDCEKISSTSDGNTFCWSTTR